MPRLNPQLPAVLIKDTRGLAAIAWLMIVHFGDFLVDITRSET